MRTVGTLATSSWIAERLQGRAQFVVPSRHERTHHEKQAGIEPLQPLTSGRDVFKAGSIAWRHVQDIDQLDAALADAGGQAVLLDFYADWCVSCTEMDRFTFTDPRVSARLAGMQLLRVDVTSNSAQDRALLKRFHLFGPPATIFLDRNGSEVPGSRVIGFESADRFLVSLALVVGPARQWASLTSAYS